MSEKQRQEIEKVTEQALAKAVRGISNHDDLVKRGARTSVFFPMEEGQEVEGTFLGAGGASEVVDPTTGEVRTRATWLLDPAGGDGKVTMRIPGSPNLDGQLGGIEKGTRIVIQHRGRVKTSRGYYANNFTVWSLGK